MVWLQNYCWIRICIISDFLWICISRIFFKDVSLDFVGFCFPLFPQHFDFDMIFLFYYRYNDYNPRYIEAWSSGLTCTGSQEESLNLPITCWCDFDPEAWTFGVHVSPTSSLKMCVTHNSHVAQQEEPAVVAPISNSFPRGPYNTFLLSFYADHVVRHVWRGDVA